MKKLLNGLVIAALCITLVACGSDKGSSKNADKDFDKYVDKLTEGYFENTDSTLNALFKNKEDFGYKDELYEHDFITLKEYKKLVEDSKKVSKELDDFNRDSLTKDQQLTYDVLKTYYEIDDDQKIEELYYLYVDYLDASYGYPSNLPVSFYFFNLRNESDVKSYLNLLKTTPEFYSEIVKHEQVRQDKGYGMTLSEIEALIKQCDDFNKGDHAFLTDTFNEKIDKLTNLSAEQKTAYKNENKKFLDENFKKAYIQLRDDLSKLNVQSKNNKGLKAYKGGKQYYADMIDDYVGFDDMKEYRKFLKGKTEDIVSNYQKLAKDNPEIAETSFEWKYTTATSPKEVLQKLEDAMKEDFPAIRDIEYTMETVPESMREIYSAAAAYYMSPVDDKNAVERMVLNGTYKQEDFPTIAHEGFPGHMYQIQYYKDVDHPLIRDFMDFNGYSEGYANYVEQYSAKYADSPVGAEAKALNDQFIYTQLLILDLEIHYDGISKDKAMKSIKSLFGVEGEDADGIYEQLLHTPALFSKYYGAGFRFADLKEEVKDEMGKSYSDKKYHEAILEVGPAPFEVVEDYVKDRLTK